MPENAPDLMERCHASARIKKAQRIPSRINKKKSIPGRIAVNLHNSENKQKILKQSEKKS